MKQNKSFFENKIVALFFALFMLLICSSNVFAQVNLTGVWNCDDGGLYYIRQLDDAIWWYGEQSSTNPGWSNVAEGIIRGNTINLNWSDVPKGETVNSGILVLNTISNNQLTATQKTGGFGGSTWTRQTTSSTPIPTSSPVQPSSAPGQMQPGAAVQLPGMGITGPGTSGSEVGNITVIEEF